MNDEQNIKRRWKLTLKDDVTVSKADLFAFSTKEVLALFVMFMLIAPAGFWPLGQNPRRHYSPLGQK